MARPRQTFPRQFYLLTRRCAQRMFLLTPSDETNRAYVYCLGVAAERYAIDILLPYAASNHEHIVLFDRDGRVSEFMEHFHKLFARCQNARLGRWEALWSSSEPCLTRLLDRQTVVDKLVYAAANPVKDLLVEKAHHWPGVNGYTNLIAQRPLHARRPSHFFAADGTMPEHVTLTLTIPAELGPAADVIAEVRAGVRAAEDTARADRAATGKRVLGRRAILAQSWTQTPTSVEPRRTLRPRFAGNRDVRIAALASFKQFLADYRDARRCWLAGAATLFPIGTYWLARFASITVQPLTVPLPTL
jgi:hypothetical protein